MLYFMLAMISMVVNLLTFIFLMRILYKEVIGEMGTTGDK